MYLDGRPLAVIDNERAFYYYHTDHLGTPQRITNSAWVLVWQANHEPLGKATVSTITNNLWFRASTSIPRRGSITTGRGIMIRGVNIRDSDEKKTVRNFLVKWCR